jgi:hypothetical protein
MNVNLRDWGRKFLTFEHIVLFLLVTVPATYLTIAWIGDIREEKELSRRGVYVIARITGREHRGKHNSLHVYVAYLYNRRKYTAVLYPPYYFAPRAGDYIYLHILPDQPKVFRYVEDTPVPEYITALSEKGLAWKEIPSSNTSSAQERVIFTVAVKDQPFIKEIIQDASTFTPQYIAQQKLSGQLIRISGEQIVGIRSFVNGSVWGEELQSFEDGKIHHYVLRVDAVNATFFRTYTSAGKIWNEEGTPIIHREIRSFKDGRVDVKLVVADRIFRDMKISCLVNGERYEEKASADDGVCGPYRVCHFTVAGKGDDTMLIFEISCRDKYTGTPTMFADTMNFSRHHKLS